MNNDELNMNDGLLTENELELVAAAGVGSVLLRGVKAVLSPVGIFLEIMLDAKPAY